MTVISDINMAEEGLDLGGFHLNVHSVTGMWETPNDLLSFGDGNTAGNSETKPKAARGCGIRR